MTARPIVVCEASPRAPTVTVRCVRAGTVLVREVTADLLAIALDMFAPKMVDAEASEVRATGADVDHATALASAATTSLGA